MRLVFLLVICALFAACGEEGGTDALPDVKTTDAGTPDTGTTDATSAEDAKIDAGTLDADSADADPTDADPTDADPTDGDPTDADPTDADPTDGDPVDLAWPDAMIPDLGSLDAAVDAGGNVDAGGADSGVRVPECRYIGTRSEGWYWPDGHRICWAFCDTNIAECRHVGTDSEGWYADKGDGCKQDLITYATCRP